MKYKHPCPDCVCYALCKSQMQEFVKEQNRTVTILGYLQTLVPKCSRIVKYIEHTYPNGTSSLNHANSIMHMTFSERWTE